MGPYALLFEPTDVLFFRDSRPFTAGQNFRASSLFPPMPEPFVGAIRTAAIVRLGMSFEDYVAGKQTTPDAERLYRQIGPPDRLGTLRIKGPFLVHHSGHPRIALPAPADLAYCAATQSGFRSAPICQSFAKSRPLKIAQRQIRLDPVAATGCEKGTRLSVREGQYLTVTGWRDYLLGLSVRAAERLDAASLWCTELRTGIQRNDRRTAEEGMFYAIDTVRFTDRDLIQAGGAQNDRHQFLLIVEGLEESLSPGAGFADHVPLGGQRRTASVEFAPTDSFVLRQVAQLTNTAALVRAIATGKSLRICLITPAIFQLGSLPDFLAFTSSGQTLMTKLAGVDLRLVSAVVPKANRIGGWSYAKRMPKEIRLAVPAGSVYYLEKANGENFTQDESRGLIDLLHFQSICRTWGAGDDLSDHGKRGLGICLLGK